MKFIRAGNELINSTFITNIDCARLEELRVHIFYTFEGSYRTLEGMDAIDAVMATNPSMLEGKRFRWIRHAWAYHNLVAHPLMQLLAWVGAHKLAMRVHDSSIPKPRGKHETR